MSRHRHLWRYWLLAGAVIAAFTALGAWQLRRGQEKQAMLDAVQRVLRERTPVPLAAASDASRIRDYDWAAGDGIFADAPPVLLDNQQRGGRTGVRAYRVFVPVRGAPLLVELGWQPVPGTRRMPDAPRPPGSLRIAGLLAPRPSHGIGEAVAIRQGKGAVLTTGLDAGNLGELLQQPRLAPRVLKLDPALPLGYARDLDILPNTLPPERHLGYAVQWFALALAVLVTALVLTFRQPREHTRPR